MFGSRIGILAIQFCLVLVRSAEVLPDGEVHCWVCHGEPLCSNQAASPCGRLGIPCTTAQFFFCSWTSPEKTCDELGIFPVLESPGKYYKCVLNELTGKIDRHEKECPRNTVFNNQTLRCLNERDIRILEVIQRDETNGNAFVCPKRGIFPDAANCSKFYVCQKYRSLVEENLCSRGTYYNDRMKGCSDHLPLACAFEMTKRFEKRLSEADALYREIKKVGEMSTGNGNKEEVYGKRSRADFDRTLRGSSHDDDDDYDEIYFGPHDHDDPYFPIDHNSSSTTTQRPLTTNTTTTTSPLTTTTTVSPNKTTTTNTTTTTSPLTTTTTVSPNKTTTAKTTTRQPHTTNTITTTSPFAKKTETTHFTWTPILTDITMTTETPGDPFTKSTGGNYRATTTPEESPFSTTTDPSAAQNLTTNLPLCETPDLSPRAEFICQEPGCFRDPFDCHKCFCCRIVSDFPYKLASTSHSCGKKWFSSETKKCSRKKPFGC